MNEEVLQRALEADFGHDLADLAVDARDFVEADLMDLRGREVGGGALAHVERVPLGAAGQLVHADGVAGGRHVFVGEEGAQLAERGHDLLADHVAVGRGEARLVGLAEVRGHRLDRAPEQGLGRVVVGHRVDLRHHLHHQRARLHHAGLHARAHAVDHAVDEHRHAIAARQPVVVVLHGLERLRPRARTEHRGIGDEAAHLVHRQHPARVLLRFERVADVFDEDLVAQQVLALQAGGADGFDLLQPALVEGTGLGAECGRIEVGHLVVVARVALQRGLDRAELEGFFPVFGVEAVEALRLGARWGGFGGAGGGGRRGAGLGDGGEGDQTRSDGEREQGLAGEGGHAGLRSGAVGAVRRCAARTGHRQASPADPGRGIGQRSRARRRVQCAASWRSCAARSAPR
jgi:hypothetical protein